MWVFTLSGALVNLTDARKIAKEHNEDEGGRVEIVAYYGDGDRIVLEAGNNEADINVLDNAITDGLRGNEHFVSLPAVVRDHGRRGGRR
jgi:hypothetical protein